MNAKKLANITRHLLIRSRSPWSGSRNPDSIGREAYAIDLVRGYDGSTRLLAEATAKGGRRFIMLSKWFKDRPFLLPYIAIVSTLEFIVTLLKG